MNKEGLSPIDPFHEKNHICLYEKGIVRKFFPISRCMAESAHPGENRVILSILPVGGTHFYVQFQYSGSFSKCVYFLNLYHVYR